MKDSRLARESKRRGAVSRITASHESSSLNSGKAVGLDEAFSTRLATLRYGAYLRLEIRLVRAGSIDYGFGSDSGARGSGEERRRAFASQCSESRRSKTAPDIRLDVGGRAAWSRGCAYFAAGVHDNLFLSSQRGRSRPTGRGGWLGATVWTRDPEVERCCAIPGVLSGPSSVAGDSLWGD